MHTLVEYAYYAYYELVEDYERSRYSVYSRLKPGKKYGARTSPILLWLHSFVEGNEGPLLRGRTCIPGGKDRGGICFLGTTRPGAGTSRPMAQRSQR